MIKHLALPIDQLQLDLDNPRLGSVSSQSEALASIVRLNRGHFANLMGSIRDNGLDPGDSLYVIPSPEGRDYIVLEGNRRLSALMVLSNADLLAGTDLSEAMRKPLVREAAGFDKLDVEPIRCVRFDDRDAANDWIRRRHTGAVGGEGRINWRPLEIQHFSGDYSTIDVIEFVGRNAGYSPEEWEHTRSVLSSGKSTNLTRLLESAAGQSRFGIKVESEPSRRTPVLGVDPNWAARVLKRIVDDILAGKVDSRRLNSASEIEKYFTGLPPEMQPGTSSVAATPKAFRDITLTSGKKSPSTSPPPVKTKSAPRTRRTLAPKKHPFDTTASTKLGMLLREAATLDITKFPLSCAFVLRAVVELALNDYLKSKSLPLGPSRKQQFDLTTKAENVVQDIRVNGPLTSTELRAFRRNLLTKHSACSIQSLNGFVHSPYDLPTADALRAGWESVIPVLIATYGTA